MNGWPWARDLKTSLLTKPRPFLLREHVLLLAACFGFATVLWMYVAASDPDPSLNRMNTREVSVPVTFTHAHLHVLESDAAAVTVTLQSMNPLPDHPVLKAIVDLDSISAAGRYKVSVSVRVFPSNLDIIATPMPDHITTFVDDIGVRPMPVAFHAEKHLSSGLVAGQPVLDPEAVTVSGPASLLSSAKVTASFDLNNVADDVDVMAQVQLSGVPEAENHLFTLKPSKVRLYLPVQHSLAYDTVTVQPYLIGVPAAGVMFQHADIIPPTVTVSGPSGAVQNLSTVLTTPINLGGARSSFITRASVVPPPGVRLESKASVLVRVKLTPAPVAPLPGIGQFRSLLRTERRHPPGEPRPTPPAVTGVSISPAPVAPMTPTKP